MPRFKRILLALPLLLPGVAFSQSGDYPNKPVKLLINSAAGGGADLQARLFARLAGEGLKRPIVAENRPGAGGAATFTALAKSPPDGYTLSTVSSPFTYARELNPNVQFDPDKDFAPVSLLTRLPYVLVVNPKLPVNNLQELIAYGKARPGQLNSGASQGALTHLSMIYIAATGGFQVTMVPYKGGDTSVLDLLAGQTQVHVGAVLAMAPHIKAGKLRGIAVTGTERTASLPDVPT